MSARCVRFGRPEGEELGEPAHPGIHLFRDSETGEITAVEVLEPGRLLSE